MANKFIYGDLNGDIVNTAYKGATTDSLKVTVDNVNNIISGDVIWSDLLGFTSDKAYPGSSGAANYQRILELTAMLNEEIEKATASRAITEAQAASAQADAHALSSSIDTRLTAEESRSKTVDEDLLSRIVAESARAIASEASLLQQLNNETQQRSDVDTEIKTRLSTLTGVSTSSFSALQQSLMNEISRATAAENKFLGKVTEERQRAQSAEASLTLKTQSVQRAFETADKQFRKDLAQETTTRQGIDQNLAFGIRAETVRSVGEETKLNNKIDSLEHATVSNHDKLVRIIDNSVQTLESVDTQLDNKINSEIEQRTIQDFNFSDQLQAKEDASIARDAALQDQIQLYAYDENSFVPQIPNDGTASRAYVQNGQEVETILIDSDATGSSIVQRDTLGNILLGDSDSYTDDSAISKHFVNNRLTELQENLMSEIESATNYDYIEGGRAPIPQEEQV